MPVREGRLDRAVATTQRIRAASISEIRDARLAAGVSQRELARAVGLSQAQVARFERGALRDVGIDLICRLAIGVGLDPSLRFYPGGDALRDAGQVRLLERLHVRLAAAVRWRTEVMLPGVADVRAWDAVVDGTGCTDAIEAETRIRDLQATTRRIARKLRDDPIVQHVILLVADTRWNRRAVADGREILRSDFPVDTRATLEALGQGRCPGANAIVFL